ncbi:hypothetical protein L9F63_013146, partial [Diploptera punctata]
DFSTRSSLARCVSDSHSGRNAGFELAAIFYYESVNTYDRSTPSSTGSEIQNSPGAVMLKVGQY